MPATRSWCSSTARRRWPCSPSGAGALLLGPALIGAHAALVIDAVLWPLGTLTGLASSLAVPYLMITRLRAAPDAAFGGWLMPVVPPMVSAATGALLVPHLPAGQARLTMLLACYAMFGLSLIASLVMITQIWQRLVQHSVGPAALVPTLWIVLGPLGQSITAANLLGGVAATGPAHARTPPRSRCSAWSTASRCGASPRCGRRWPPR